MGALSNLTTEMHESSGRPTSRELCAGRWAANQGAYIQTSRMWRTSPARSVTVFGRPQSGVEPADDEGPHPVTM